jgi:hypothetical protein
MSFASVGLTNVLLAIIAIVNLAVLLLVYRQQKS